MGGGGLPPPANPDNVATGGATDARCGGGGKVEGGGEGWHEADNSPQQPIFPFLLVFLSAVYLAGFDKNFARSRAEQK